METNSVGNIIKLLESIQYIDDSKRIQKLNEFISKQELIDFLRDQKCFYDENLPSWFYSCRLFYLVKQIMSEIDIDAVSSPIDINQKNSLVNAIQECSKNSLEICVKKQNDRITYKTTDQDNEEYLKLTSSIRMFHKFISIKLIATNVLFDDTKIDYIVGIFAVLSMKRNESDIEEFKSIFSQIESQIGIERYFKFVFMIKGFKGLSKDFHLLVQRELIRMIRGKNGFILLCKNLLKNGDENSCQKLEIIAKIIAEMTKNPMQRKLMTIEIFRSLRMSFLKDESDITSACVFVLNSFLSTENEEILEVIKHEIVGPLDNLINPNTTLCGSILMEYSDFSAFVETLNALFSTSTITSLPSKILHQHVAALFDLYSIIPEITERAKLGRLIQFVFHNSSRRELQSFLRSIRLKDDSQTLKLSPRVIFKNNSLQIGEESSALRDDTDSFMNLLKSSNNNLLTFEIFICLLQILSDVQHSSESYLTGYDLDIEELPEVLHRKFFKKLSVIEPLQEMIQWKSLHSQLNENPKAVLDAIKKILEKSINDDEEIVIIFFSLFKELSTRIRCEEEINEIMRDIIKLKDKIKDEHVKTQVCKIINDNQEILNVESSKIAYDDAIKLIQSNEIYNKVYGSNILMKMIKQRDQQAIVNRHTILAIAIENMRENESYAYLNIIRLLSTLAYVMDSEVIDALIAEFNNSENNTDHRLKFGEVIVKVTEDLGGLSVKFKKQLIQCFLKGIRDPNNEFRTSSLANLGAICRILCYQIHNFFHEMFQQLDIIIKCDEYLPSKRAATMVLSEILAGMPDLMTFQEFLLPIYHTMKEILANEEDEKIKLHAQIGLEHLNEKTKDFLNPQVKIQKEIKVHLDDNPHKIAEIKYK